MTSQFFITVFLAATIFSRSGSAAGWSLEDPVREVSRWAACFEHVESVEITWDMERPTLTLDRKRHEMLRADIFLRARWPDGLDVRTGRARGPTDPPQFPDDPFVERIVRTPGGEFLEFSERGAAKSVRRARSTVDLSQSGIVWLEGAPLLAGKWLHAVGLPQHLAEVRANQDGSLTIDIPSRQIRATLSPHEGPTGRSLVLSRVVSLGNSGSALCTYEFSDFRPVAGAEAPVGFHRTVTLSKDAVYPIEGAPEIPRVREDVLLEAKVLPRFDASEFSAPTAGFVDITETRPPPRPPAPAHDPPAPSPVDQHSGSAAPARLPWFAGMGVGLLLAATVVTLRAGLRRQ
jgi:hypothetical protein